MKIKKGDKVKIIAGKDLGKIGMVLKVLKDENRVIVEGINIVSRHVKPGAVSKEGGIIKKEAPINISNVMFYDEALGRPVRLGSKMLDGKKYRVNKVTGEALKQ